LPLRGGSYSRADVFNEAVFRRGGILMSETDAEKAASPKIFRLVPTPREDAKKSQNANKRTSPPGGDDNDPGPAAA
jgi:hypothetical protein